MLRTLKDLFDSLTQPAAAAGPADAEHRVRLATAVLLVEVMRADAGTSDAERRSVLAALRAKFGLAEDELARLVELAEQTQRQATDFFGFTSALNDTFSPEQKLRVVQAMWDVAFADGQLAAHEQHVLWRVADLLHVPQGAYVNARMRVQGEGEGG